MTDKTLRSGTMNDTRIEAGTGQLYTPEGIPLTSGSAPKEPTVQNVIEVVQGKQGIQGKKGSDGRSILSGARDPDWLADGVIGDFFLNTVTMVLFGPKQQTGWGEGVSLKGERGPRGLAGPPGNSILHGVIDPSDDLGNEGDFYVDTAASVLWGPKRSTGWEANDQLSIRGRQGLKGDRGDDGVDGRTILNGIGAPNASAGEVGDFYLDTESYLLFGPKTGSGWGVGFVMKGLKGDKGDRGEAGELAGSIDTDRVTYRGQPLTGVLDTLLYVAPVISAFSASVTEAENGASVPSVNLTWTLNKTPVSQSLDGSGLAASARSFTANGPFTVNRTFTLVMTDEKTSVNRTASLTFKNKRYWGVSANQSLTDQDIRGLTSELTTSRGRAITYDATGGRYVYYCYPASLGTVTATVGGLAFSDFTVTTRNFTNASGYTTSYNIVRFNAIQTGASIQVVWA